MAGALVAEVVAGGVQDAASLAAEVARARGLEALAHFVAQWQQLLAALGDVDDVPGRATTEPARQAGFARGLEDGLCGRTVPHPSPGVPPVRPSFNWFYERGYDHGDAMRRALALLQAARGDGARGPEGRPHDA